MGAVAQAVSNVVSDVFEAAGDAVSDVGKAVEQVGQTVGNVAQAVANDPIPVLVAIAATPVLGPAAAAIGLPSAAVAPLTAAAISAAQGNSIEEVALSAAASFAGGQVAGQIGGALSEAPPVIQDIVPSAAQGAVQAAITGQDPLTAALASGVAGGVSGQVTPELGQTAGQIAGQTAGTVAAGGDLAQALGSSLASAGIGQVSGAVGDIFGGGTAQPTDVATAPEEQTMDEILAEMIAQELETPSTPSPYAPIAAGGVVSDVAPTPLVPSEPIGTVTQELIGVPELVGEGIAFEDLPPLPEDVIAETPTIPQEPTYTPPISQQDQQIIDLLQQIVATQPQAPTPQAPTPQVTPTPEIVPTPQIPTIEQPVTAEVTPETFVPEEPAPVTEAPMTTPPISAGPVEQPQAPTAPPMAGMTEEERRTREILDLIGVPAGEGPRESMGMGTTEMAGTLPGTGAGVEEPVTGESMGMEADEGEFVDTGPREPLATEQVAGITPMVVMGGAPTARATRRTGFAPSDSTLGALLGTALTPSGATEPILGEDESRRRAVWNIESLRNALGI